MDKNRDFINIRRMSDFGDIDESNVKYYDEGILIMDTASDAERYRAVRMNMYTIAICKNGQVQVDLNGETVRMGKKDLLISPPNTTIENVMSSPNFECRFICFTNEVLQTFLRPYVNIWNQAVYKNKLKVRNIDEYGLNFESKFYEMLKLYVKEVWHTKYKKQIVRALIQAGILGLCASLDESDEELRQEDMKSGYNIFQRFLSLLGDDGGARRSVTHYASKLCVTPKYLSMLCVKNSGKSAKEWIDEYVTENARYYLRSTDKSIKEIAVLLNFPNASYFARYIKEHLGVSPMAYRCGEEQKK